MAQTMLRPKYEKIEGPLPPNLRAGPSVALFPAGGELWEDFLDTIGVPLEKFCCEGPGGWILGYIKAFASSGIRTIVVLFSGQAKANIRYTNPADRSLIVVIPISVAYRRLRHRFPTYQDTLAGKLRTPPARVIGAALSHLSTPVTALLRELRSHGCRAILCQEYEYFRFGVLSIVGRLLRVPVFATFQGSNRDPDLLSGIWKSIAVRRAAGLIIPTAVEAARVRARYGDDVRILPIFNPVDTSEWTRSGREEERRRLGAGPNTRIVVWHGRTEIFVKGLDLLVAAWLRVRRERSGRDLRLMLLGTGEDAAALGRHIAGAHDVQIDWRDEYVTDREAVRRFLVAGDIYAFPSRLEGFPVAPLEAMACGLPVVGADASGVREILANGTRGGVLVPTDDVDAFAAALGRLVDNPSLSAELGREARMRIESVFSVEAVGRQFAELLSSGSATVGSHS